MKKILCLVLCAAAYIGVAKAQSGTITGKVTDPNGNGLAGAVVEYTSSATPNNKRHETSAAGGAITLRNVAAGTYNITISFLGYKTIEKTISVSSGTANLGSMQFEEDSQQIGTVEVEGIAIRTSQRGDTVSYNANAFKVNADADVEGLLAKMPGITVSQGKVEAHGEEVKKVYLNGKEVFGDDVSTAITSIPADMVDRVEVFNKLSDNAEFTGIDDGQGFKALNIVTPADRVTARSGRIYGAYGYADKYLVGAKLNVLNNESTLILNGLFNNINQQNFSFDDLLEASGGGGFSSEGGRMWQYSRPQEGVATTQAIAVNYNDSWGAMRTINGRSQRPVKFSGNFTFRHLDTHNENETWRWDYLSLTNTSAENRYSETESTSNSGRYDTRFGSRIEWTIDENNQLSIRPSFNLQFSDSYTTSMGEQYHFTDASNPKETPFIPLNAENEENHRWGLNAGLSGNWRTRLGKAGRTLVFNFGGRYNLNNRLSLPEQEIGYDSSVGKPNITSVKKIVTDSYGYSLNGGVTYTEPLSTKSALTLEYRADYSYSDSEKLTYEDPTATYPFGTPHFNTDYDNDLSSIYNSGYLTQRVTPGFRYASEKLNFNAGVSYENALRSSDQTIPSSRAGNTKYSFENVLYSAMLTYNINKTNSLRIRLNSYAQNPSIDQLQEVVDENDIIRITMGNAGLQPAYTHRLWANYVLSNITAGTTLTIAASLSGSNNYISQSVITSGSYQLSDGTQIDIPDGGTLSRPVNMTGYWSSFGFVSYGFPIKFLKSNMTLGLSGFFSGTPSEIDGQRTDRSNNFYSGDISLGSNISQNIDFTIGYRAGYNVSTSVSVVGGQRFSTPNDSFMQYVSASLKWVIWQGITFSANATYSMNRGITDEYNDEYIIVNAYVGKKFLKSQRLEISVGVNDMLDQNRSFRRTVQSTYIQNSQNLAIGRYFAIQATFNLRSVGNTGNQPSQGDRQMGPPPGGIMIRR